MHMDLDTSNWSSQLQQQLCQRTEHFPNAHKLSLRPKDISIIPHIRVWTNLKAECRVDDDLLCGCVKF
jgi:hypothetical protein